MSTAGAYTYAYDCNGNMTSRTEAGITYAQGWDAENHLTSLAKSGTSQVTTYVYDGDGRRVQRTVDGVSTVYIGNLYEKNLSTGVITKYYYAGGKRIAMRTASGVTYLHGDQLGSSSASTNAAGALTANARTKPYGCLRADGVPTDYKFTGQRIEATLGPPGCQIYDFGARFYDPVSGRFLSADSIVPGAGNPQALNRYSFSNNNPLHYTDPSGHDPWDVISDFMRGFFYQIGYSANPIPSGYVGSAGPLAVKQDEPDAMLVGRLAGSVGGAVLSYAEIATGVTVGTGGAAGGLLTCAETLGGGCAVGAAAVVGGATLVTEGVLTGVKAAESAGQATAI